MKLSILFYLTNKNNITIIKDFVKTQTNGWVFYFFENINDTKNFLNLNEIDIVVYETAGGRDSLSNPVRELIKEHSKVLFINFASINSNEIIFKVTNVIHQFSIKPLSTKTFRRKIENIFFLREFFKNEKLFSFINKIDKLPSLPELYMALERESQSQNISLRKISAIISKDISMTAKILRVVNSAFFSIPFEVLDIQQAINYLGVEVIKSLVLVEKTFSSTDFSALPSTSVHQLWEHSFKTAKINRDITLILTKSNSIAEQSYITGVLHDIGKLIVWKLLANHFKIKLDKKNTDELTIEKEFELFHSNHAEIGAYLLGLWGFSTEIIKSIYYHHNKEIQNFDEFSLSQSIYIANALSDNKLTAQKEDLLNLPLNDEIKKYIQAVMSV